MKGLTLVFGMGTSVSPSPWRPILDFLARRPASGEAGTLPTLLANRGVGCAQFLAQRNMSTPRSKLHYLLALHPSKNPRNGVHRWAREIVK